MDIRGRQELDRLATQMRALVDGQKGSHFDSATREKWDRLQAAWDAKAALVCAAENRTSLDGPVPGRGSRVVEPVITAADIPMLQDLYRLTPAEKREREKHPVDRAFSNYLRFGLDKMPDDDREVIKSRFTNAQSTTTTSAGGALVPQGFSDMLDQAMLWYGGIDGVVGELQTSSGNVMPYPTVNDTMNKGAIIGQNSPAAEQDFVFANVTFNAYIGTSLMVLIPVALMEDSYFDMDKLTAEMLGTRLGRLLNWKCTVGTGSGEPTGIVTAAVAAGNVMQLGAGNITANTYANLVALEGLVDPAYRERPSSRWMFSDGELQILKKLVDGNSRPLWSPGISASIQDGAAVTLSSKPRILDHPYVINQDMAVPTGNAYSMLFGDMSKFKLRKIGGGVTVLRLVERFAEYWQVGFVAFMRFDSNLVDAGTHPIAVLQQSAS